MVRRLRLCVDFDGTIVDHEFPEIGALKPGVRTALRRFRQLGHYIVISSCRTCRWDEETFGSWDCPILERPKVREMIEFLDREKIPYDEIDDGTKGKVLADLYIDDKGLRFQDNWFDILELVSSWTSGEPL